MHQTKKRYQCDSCSATFNDLQTFEIHKRLHLQKSVKCSVCNAVFSGVRSMKFHMWKAHEISKVDHARNMMIMNWEAKSFPPNLNKQINNNPTDVSADNVSDPSNKLILNNADDTSEEKIYKCCRCNKTFKYEFSIAKHLRNHLKKGQLNNIHNNEDYCYYDHRNAECYNYESPNFNGRDQCNSDVIGELCYNDIRNDESVNEHTSLFNSDPGLKNGRIEQGKEKIFTSKMPLNKIIITSSLKRKKANGNDKNHPYLYNDIADNVKVLEDDDINNDDATHISGIGLNLSVDDLGLVKIENNLDPVNVKTSKMETEMKNIKSKNKRKVNFECLTCSATFEFDFCYFAHIKQHEVMHKC